MCGIVGVVGNADATQNLKKALEQLKHRGPDGEGIWQSDGVSLGHRRLAIIDISDRANQPFISGNKVLVFNGEIYNYLELKKELQSAGHHFVTTSDTEVLLKAYEHWGRGCVSRFNGMWAFAIWDQESKTLFLSRDRNGQKPLFYADTSYGFVFASEMKGIYPFLKQIEVDRETFQDAYQNPFSYEATDKCLVRGINRFPAAHSAVYENNQLLTFRYYDPLESKLTVPKHYDEQVSLFRELFIDSCRLRMRSDVPIGTALSGGIDSSSVLSTMCHILKQDSPSAPLPQAFVATFPGTSHDEERYARTVIESTGVEATFTEINPQLELDSIFYQQYQFEELYYGPTIPFVQLYRSVKSNGISVTLDGHGADEMFAGYGFDIKVALVDEMGAPHGSSVVLKALNDCFGQNLSDADARKWVAGQVSTKSKRSTIGALSHLNSTLYRATYENYLPTLLRNYDRYSMMNSVEIRMPFLDHRIQELAWKIPNESKLAGGLSKSIVRDAMKGILPGSIRTRKSKLGFNSPMDLWFNRELKSWINDQIHSEDFKEDELYDSSAHKKEIQKLLKSDSLTKLEGRAGFQLLMPYIWKMSVKHMPGYGA